MTKIIGISGSPRKDGYTNLLLEKALRSAEKKGVEIKTVNLSDYRIEYCRGCWNCINGNCVIEDDANQIYREVFDSEADALIMASPVYTYNVPGILKNFIERRMGVTGQWHSFNETFGSNWKLLKEFSNFVIHGVHKPFKVGVGISLAGASGGQGIVLKHLNLFLLEQCQRILPGVSLHLKDMDSVSLRLDSLGEEIALLAGSDLQKFSKKEEKEIYEEYVGFTQPDVNRFMWFMKKKMWQIKEIQ